jgi:predicted MFS family arabinose efflux permease
MWALGMGVAAMLGGALGGSFVKERGRKVLPVVIVLTILCGLAIGYGLNGELDAIEATSH